MFLHDCKIHLTMKLYFKLTLDNTSNGSHLKVLTSFLASPSAWDCLKSYMGQEFLYLHTGKYLSLKSIITVSPNLKIAKINQ